MCTSHSFNIITWTPIGLLPIHLRSLGLFEFRVSLETKEMPEVHNYSSLLMQSKCIQMLALRNSLDHFILQRTNHLVEMLKTTSGWLPIYEMPNREEKRVTMIFIIVWPLGTCIVLHKGLMKFPNFGIIVLVNVDLKFCTLRSLDEAIQRVTSLWVEKNSLTIISCSKKALDCVCQV